MINNDYKDFLDSKGSRPPEEVSEKIIGRVMKDLNPSHFVILFKLIGIQAFIGFITLLFCPQFKLSLTNNHELFHYFHRTFGHYGCMAVCGAVFIGSGSVFASYVLKLPELQKIRKSKYLHMISITGISITVFLLAGAEVYLETSIFWAIGAISAGISMMEINKSLRLEVMKFYR